MSNAPKPITRSRGLRLAKPLPRDTRPHASHSPPPPVNYRQLVIDVKQRYKIAIRHWRNRMSGHAYELTYHDGTIKRLISAPRPKSPVSAAVFLHEVGHHAIGFRRYHSRCLEEHYVWQWTFREMEKHRIPITSGVMKHFRRSMYHYVRQSHQRGVHVPPELAHFAHWPG